MARTLLNSLSTIEIILLSVGAVVTLTLIGVLLARRLFPRLADSEFEPVADSLRVVYELIFALILAFVIAAVLDTMGEAESAVASEATTIAGLVQANDALPIADRKRLDDAVEQYVHAVADDEWRTMKDGRPSAQATAALEGMFAEYRDVTPKGAAQDEFFSQALTDLRDVVTKRRQRLDIASADLPTMLRVLVVVGLILLLVLEYRPQLSRFAGLVFMGTLATIVTSAFLLTVILNYPFAGDVSVSSDPLKQGELARFWSAELAYRPRSSDARRPLTAARLQGVWNSDAYGTIVLRCDDAAAPRAVRGCRPGDTRMRGVYRYHDGTISGAIVRGVFRGWWTESPRRSRRDSGVVQWRLLDTAKGQVVSGTWSYAHGARRLGWDLEQIGGADPPDLRRRFTQLSTFTEDPRGAAG